MASDQPKTHQPSPLPPREYRTVLELQASEHRYRNLIQYIPIPLWQVDARAAGRAYEQLRAEGVHDLAAYLEHHPELIEYAKDNVIVTEANDEAVRLFRSSSKAELIRPVRYLFHAAPHASRGVMIARFSGKRNFIEQMKIRTFDGETRDVMFLVTFPAPPELLDTTLLMMLDITEQLRALAKLRKTEADFAHAARLSMLGEFASSIAHEVNQPLTAILTNAQTSLRWLSHDPADVGEARDSIARVVSGAEHAASVVKRIRDMAAKREPERVLVDLKQIVEAALLFVRAETEAASVLLTTTLPAGLPKVAGDRVQLQQVVVNLLVNSLQAMASNEGQPSIEVFARADPPDAVTLTIRDTGPGIPEDKIDRLFESFFTTKEGGMGIGLSICQSIILAHGGTIAAANHPLGGAIFTVKLPSAA